MKTSRRAFAVFAVASALLCGWGAASAASKTVAYISPYAAYTDAYLIEWQGGTQAHVVNLVGHADGAVSTNGSQRVITLSSPISQQYLSPGTDSCGNQVMQQQDTLQVAVNSLSGTDNRGTSSVIELGTITTLEGCDAGQVQPFGSLSDPGFKTDNLSMALRPSVSDLVPGASIAGLSEDAGDDSGQLSADVATFLSGGEVKFSATGNTVAGAFDADKWLQLGLPSGPRAYTRIAVDRRSGAERWLRATWAAGRPTTVAATLMVKPLPGAGFGNLRQASRMWQSGIATTDLNAFYIYLFQDGTGDRVSVDLTTGTESHSAITSWAFDGNTIVQKRGKSLVFTRTWVPLANGGGRTRFVMEAENYVSNGETFINIKPRVNVYTDTGPATPPPTVRR